MVSTGVAALATLQSSATALSTTAFHKVKTVGRAAGPHMIKLKTVHAPVMVCDKFSQFRNAATLTSGQLIALLRNAGFTGNALRVAWAVAMRESHGHPLSHNTNRYTGDNSYGLFQVNMIGAMGADRRAWLGLKSNDELLDPVTNVQAVYRMTRGGKDWGSWGLGSGAYKGAASPSTIKQWLNVFPRAAAEY